MRPVLVVASGVVAVAACGPRPAFAPAATETPAACEARKEALVAFVRSTEGRGVVATSRVDIPESTLGRAVGGGHLFELSSRAVFLDGDAVEESTEAGRVGRFRAWVASFAGPKTGEGTAPVLYVAADRVLEIRALRAYLAHVPESVELRLLVLTTSPSSPGGVLSEEGTAEARRVAQEVWSERDPERRRELATRGYTAHASCEALSAAVSGVTETRPDARWPALRGALLEALPACSCTKLDTASLRLIAGAELRGGAASLGWVPLGFLRDPRCDASMPLRAVHKLVRQIEEFDVEFSGTIGDDALSFQDVLVSDRLRVFFCDALPGELLAAKQRAKSTIHFRVPGLSSCDAFAFEPLAAGSPMGTLRRAPGSTRPPLAFHYWQGAEEIRLFGPLDPAVKSLPTDATEYPCNATLRFQSVDEHAITLEGGGRWFMSQEACARSGADTAREKGCVAAVAAGVMPAVR